MKEGEVVDAMIGLLGLLGFPAEVEVCRERARGVEKVSITIRAMPRAAPPKARRKSDKVRMHNSGKVEVLSRAADAKPKKPDR